MAIMLPERPRHGRERGARVPEHAGGGRGRPRPGQHGLGFMYLEGECAERDAVQAAEWFRKAAEQGLQGR